MRDMNDDGSSPLQEELIQTQHICEDLQVC